MKNLGLLIIVAGTLMLSAFTSTTGKMITKSAHINFFSHMAAEDISADNFKAISTIDPSTGIVVFSIPMQSFEFKKSLMQKHFNSSKFLDTKTHPRAKFKGTISNLSAINFEKDGVYQAEINGDMTIKGVTNKSTEKGVITIKDGKITLDAKTKIVLADYKIAFEKGKPSTNIAKEIDVTIKAEYSNKN